jgi:hypothetical protein
MDEGRWVAGDWHVVFNTHSVVSACEVIECADMVLERVVGRDGDIRREGEKEKEKKKKRKNSKEGVDPRRVWVGEEEGGGR